MNKYVKLSVTAIVASLAMLALASTATADTTLMLFEHDTVQNKVDFGAPGPGPGDQFIFAGDVFDRPGGMFLGTTGGSCTTLTGNDNLASRPAMALSTSQAARSSSRASTTLPRCSAAVTPCRCPSSEVPGSTRTPAATGPSRCHRMCLTRPTRTSSSTSRASRGPNDEQIRPTGYDGMSGKRRGRDDCSRDGDRRHHA